MLEQNIKQKALSLGFDAVGITTAQPLAAEHLQRHMIWLEKGFAAQMRFLYRHMDKRFQPQKLLAGAQSVICVAVNYRLPEPFSGKPTLIAHFAAYDDYHDWIKSRLAQLADFLQKISGNPVGCKIVCDATPLAERPLAQRAGLGFIGKNHNLIHPQLGCQILLAELITTLPLQSDTPFEENLCADCQKCIQGCPAGALSDDGEFDANRCISAQTQGYALIPAEGFAAPALLGCDRCLLACPYHQKAPPAHHPDWPFFPQRLELTCRDVLNMTEQAFQQIFGRSCASRFGLKRLQENAQRCPPVSRK